MKRLIMNVVYIMGHIIFQMISLSRIIVTTHVVRLKVFRLKAEGKRKLNVFLGIKQLQ